MPRILWMLVSSLVVTGCAPQLVWVRQGATQADFERDKYACLKENQTGRSYYLGTYYGSSQAQVDVGMFAQCMRARGYRLQHETAHATPVESTPPVPSGQRPLYQSQVMRWPDGAGGWRFFVWDNEQMRRVDITSQEYEALPLSPDQP